MRKLNQNGSFIVMLTLSFSLLGTFIGFALDFGHAYLARARLHRLVDAAALSAAKSLQGQTGFEAKATRAACDSMVTNGATVVMTATGTCEASTGAPIKVAVGFFDVQVPGGPPLRHVQITADDFVSTTFLRFLSWLVPGDYSTIPIKAMAQAGPERPIDLMLVLDRSGSMTQPDGTGKPKINSLKTTVNEFLDNSFSSLDRVGMVSFASRGCGDGTGRDSTTSSNCVADVDLDLATTSFLTTLKSRVNSLVAEGLTNTMEAIQTARRSMAVVFDDPNRATTRKAVLLITDGQPTALRRVSDSDCKRNPRDGTLLASPGDSGSFPSGCKHGATESDRMRRQPLGSGGQANWETIPPGSGTLVGIQLFRDVVRCTRSLINCVTNGAMYEANILRNCGYSNSGCTAAGAHDIVVFAIAIGRPDPTPNYSLDRNAKCLLARIANATDIINTGTSTLETMSTLCQAPADTTSDGDTHADLQEGWPCGTGPCIDNSQEKGKVYVVDLNGNVQAQLQVVFKDIASILKLRLTL